ncbi:FAD-dependent oxidoreductase [Niastella vici]|uniref:FAD-dependent oxidoreductase n=1 Tax=Niastella vici TaxID=1703345 RepID=A0A1V9FFW2_9BACT|nr:FAD-dependent monooxygenase [Niastella vici]OQP57248.1 FAD-dependent oxidoreductase [Niastella vici]
MKAQDHAVYDVIISGAGPVGLFLAGELALANCSVLILEKADNPHSPLKQFPFGMRGLSTPTIEALYRRGLLDELAVHKRLKTPHFNSPSVQGKPQPGGHFAGIQFNSTQIDTSQWTHRLPGATDAPFLMSEMAEMETVLARHAETLGVTIRRGLAVTEFQQNEEGVTVHTDGQSFTGKWLVGCDGSRSVVRKLGGFEFAGTEPEFTGYSTKVEIADPGKLGTGRIVTPTGMYLLSQADYVIIQDFDGGAFHNSQQPITREHVQEVLRRISNTDVTINALHIATTWTDRSRQATSYRNGRVLLAGDAAHIHSPLGGQGLNLGLGDAMNLGWKLAATIQQKAPEGLLNSYFTERYPIGAQVLDWSRAQVAIMRPNAAARALHAIIRDLLHTRDGATYFAGRIWGINNHYNNPGGGQPLTGHSVPNFEFEDGTKIGRHMHDGKGILLDLTMNASLKKLAGEYGGQIKYVSAKVKEQLGLHVVLIRPDGIIAWAADTDADTSELQKAAAKWFA